MTPWAKARRVPPVAASEPSAVVVAATRASLLGACAEWTVLCLAALIVAAVGADALGLPLRPAVALPIAFFLLAPVAISSWRRRALKPDPLTDAALLLVALLIGGVLIAPAWPDLLPPGTSPDAVHHTALANYLRDHGRLIRGERAAQVQLIEMAEYPPGFAILTVLGSQILGLEPVRLIYPFAALVVVLGVVSVALLIAQSVPASTRPLAIAASAAALLMPAYIFGIVAIENYYGQALAQLLIVAAAYTALRHVQQPGSRFRFRLVLLLLALLFSYTTWLPVALLAVGGALLIVNVRWRDRILWIAIVIVPAALLAVPYALGRASTGATVLLYEGSTIRDPLAATGVAIPILALIGLTCGWQTRERRVGLLVIGAAIGHAAALFVLWQRGIIAGYIYYKSYYLIALLLLVPLGWLVADVATRLLRGRSRRAQVVVQSGAMVAMVAIGVVVRPSLATARSVSLSMAQAADWIRANGDPAEAAYALRAPGLPAYWLHVGLLRQPRTAAAHALLTTPPTSFDAWYFDPETPRTLLLEQPAPPAITDGLDVQYANACCTILRKNDGYAAALDRQRPLLVNYRVAMADGRMRVEARAFDQISQPDLTLRVVAQGHDRVLAAFDQAVPQRAGRVQHIGVAIDPLTLAGSGFANEQAAEWAAVNPQTPYQFRVQLLHGDAIVREQTIAECAAPCETPAIVQPRGEWALYQPAVAAADLTPRGYTLGDAIALTGSLVDRDLVAPGATVNVDLRWNALQPIGTRYTTFVQLIAADGGAALSVEGEANNGAAPTWRWQSGDSIDARWQLRLPDELQPGRYELVVGMYDPATGQRLAAWQRTPSIARFWSDALPLGTIEVRR